MFGLFVPLWLTLSYLSLLSVHVIQAHIHKTVPRWSGQLSVDTFTGIFLHKGRDGWNKHLLLSPHPDSVTGNRHCSTQGVPSTVWDILLWKALCSLHHLFGQPSQHPRQQGKGPCAPIPKQASQKSYIACNCLLFNSSGFLWHGYKTSFIRLED